MRNGNTSKAGGAGIVVIKETTPKCASGVWDMNSLYDQVSDDDWMSRRATTDYLVVAGGGGGSCGRSGGGGAGG